MAYESPYFDFGVGTGITCFGARRTWQDMMAKLNSNQISCMNSGCHNIVHDVSTLNNATFWNGAK